MDGRLFSYTGFQTYVKRCGRGYFHVIGVVKTGNARVGVVLAHADYAWNWDPAFIVPVNDFTKMVANGLVAHFVFEDDRAKVQYNKDEDEFWLGAKYSYYPNNPKRFWDTIPSFRLEDVQNPVICMTPYRIYRGETGVEVSILVLGAGILDNGAFEKYKQYQLYDRVVLGERKIDNRTFEVGSTFGSNFCIVNINLDYVDLLCGTLQDAWIQKLKEGNKVLNFFPQGKPFKENFCPYLINTNMVANGGTVAVNEAMRKIEYMGITKDNYKEAESLWNEYKTKGEETLMCLKQAFTANAGNQRNCQALNHILGLDYNA